MPKDDRILLKKEMSLQVYKDQKDKFKAGDLWKQWSATYPRLFLDHDLITLENQARTGHHFHEFLASVLLLENNNWLSLVVKYQWANHPQKHNVMDQINSHKLDRGLKFIRTEMKGRYGPDLVVYNSDFSEWFFCEVKGPKDRWDEEQIQDYKTIAEKTGKPVRLMKFRKIGKKISITLWEDFQYEIG